jgi:hypothetical protein
MPDEKEPKETKELSPGAKYALIGTIVTAVVGLIGTGLTLYFNYLEKIEPQRLAIQATQTAEARQTELALRATATVTHTPTATLAAVPTLDPTLPAASPTATFTPTLTATATNPASGIKYCVDTAALNVRAGPGSDFNVIGALRQDDCIYFDAYAVYEGGYYWLRISPGQVGILDLGGAWVYGAYLRPQDFDRLPAATPPPPPERTPTPAG